jgi:hypothetical protein
VLGEMKKVRLLNGTEDILVWLGGSHAGLRTPELRLELFSSIGKDGQLHLVAMDSQPTLRTTSKN